MGCNVHMHLTESMGYIGLRNPINCYDFFPDKALGNSLYYVSSQQWSRSNGTCLLADFQTH